MKKAKPLDSFQFGLMARQKAEMVRAQLDIVITEARIQVEARVDDPLRAAVRKIEQAADEAAQKLDALTQVAFELQSEAHDTNPGEKVDR